MMHEHKVLILGGNSRLINHFIHDFTLEKIKFSILKRKEFNYVIETNKLTKLISKNKYSLVINLCAISAYSECEKNKINAFYVNSIFPFQMAKICKKNKIKLIHFSTDAVFSNSKTRGLNKISDFANPTNCLGRSKLLGELLLNQFDNCLTIRLPMVYGEFIYDGYIYKAYLSLLNKINIKASNRVFSSPTNFKNVMDYIKKIILIKKNNKYEFKKKLIHISDNNIISRYNLIKIIAKKLKREEYLILKNDNKNFNLEIIANLGLESSIEKVKKKINFKYMSHKNA